MYKIKVSVGGITVKIGALCPNEISERGWSLARIQEQKDVDEQFMLAKGLRDALAKMGVHRAYAPNVAEFSARVLNDTSLLKKQIDLGQNIIIRRDKSVPADGVLVKSGYAFVMSGAGCPVIIATAGDDMVVAHAGRGSLIDRNAVNGDPSRREHESVVDAIVNALVDRGYSRDEITMCMELALPASAFMHRFDGTYGACNRALCEFVEKQWPCAVTRKNGGMLLDLESLFEEQARRAGVTYWAENSLAEFPALAHTRDGKDSSRRNLIIVKRCS